MEEKLSDKGGSYTVDHQGLFELQQVKFQDPVRYARILKAIVQLEEGKLSDGYHSFNELYAHRNMLWMLVCSLLYMNSYRVQKEKLGRLPNFEEVGQNIWRKKVDDEWFLLGLYYEQGKQITYHLPMSMWQVCDEFARAVSDTAPVYDGHTSDDVLKRLTRLI